MTYRLEYLEIDSSVLGFHTWMLDQISDSSSFATALDGVKRTDRSSYVTCKIEIDRIDQVHAAETLGFHYVETQFKTVLRLNKSFDTTKFPYDYVRIESVEDLSEVLEIAEKTIDHDRFSRDPRIGSYASGLRYRKYLEDSFLREDDQIWAVRNRSTGQFLTFRSHRHVSQDEVSLLIGGVHPKYKDIGLGIISSHFCFNQLREAGYRRAVTHISAANTPIVNLELGHLGFRVSQTYVVMRTVV